MFVLLNKTVVWLSIWSAIHFINSNKINGLWMPEVRWNLCILLLTNSCPWAGFTVRQQTQTEELVAGNKLRYRLQQQHTALRISGLMMVVPLNTCWAKILWFKGTTSYYKLKRLALHKLHTAGQLCEQKHSHLSCTVQTATSEGFENS